MQISALYIYPVKSLGGISVKQALVERLGFQHDRRWMLVDSSNRFMTQRTNSNMSLMRVSLTDEALHVSYLPRQQSIVIPFRPLTGEFATVTIWDDQCTGQFVSADADLWFSTMLGISCRLVYMPDETLRPVDREYAGEGKVTSFTDGYPFMMIGQSSLDDLNARLVQPLPMDRFRPNIVFTGGAPYAEDELQDFTIRDVTFRGVKLCTRCVVTTIDQESGIKGKEPLLTLSRYRAKNNSIRFGQNLIHEGAGMIAVGDELKMSEPA